MNKIDQETLIQQQKLLKNPSTETLDLPKPFTDYIESKNLNCEAKGKQWIASGKAGCIVIAGGQGTRLGFNGPKGMYPVTVIKKKTLFQLLLEKVHYAGKQAGRPLDLAIMTSPENHQETAEYLNENNYFGLDENQISLFQQETLPFLNDQGDLIYQTPTEIAVGPNGNGDALKLFSKTQTFDQWKEKGIELVNVVLIDNALSDPYEATLFGYHSQHLDSDIVMQCTKRIRPDEKMGVLVERDGVVSVREYSEMPEEEMKAKEGDSLKYCVGNLSTFTVKLALIEKAREIDLPLHLAHKSIEYLEKGKLKKGKMWKFEKFIFDLFPFAKNVKAILYPRNLSFAPLKNKEGNNSPETVRKHLQDFDRLTIEKITGLPAPDRAFELSPEFSYPTDELLSKWKGKEVPKTEYIIA